jgi:hypothetical protein
LKDETPGPRTVDELSLSFTMTLPLVDDAHVAQFLASGHSGFVTGRDCVVDGGLVALGPQVLQRLYGL